MCFENKIHALLKKYSIKKRISILTCGVFNFRFVYTFRILRYFPCRPHITHMTLLYYSLTLLTSLTHLLTHTYTYTLTRSHSVILTYTHTLTLTYLLTHLLTYLYLLKNTHSHSPHSYSPTYTHIHLIPPFLCGSRSQYIYNQRPERPGVHRGPLFLRGRRGVMCIANGVRYT